MLIAYADFGLLRKIVFKICDDDTYTLTICLTRPMLIIGKKKLWSRGL